MEIEDVTIHVSHDLYKTKAFRVLDRLEREKNTPNLEVLSQAADLNDCDVFIFGHHHLFMDEVVNKKRFICVGSVGMPLNGDPRAQYMVLDINQNHITTSKQYVDYDLRELVRDFEEKGFLEKHSVWSMNTLITMLTGHNYIGTQDLRNK